MNTSFTAPIDSFFKAISNEPPKATSIVDSETMYHNSKAKLQVIVRNNGACCIDIGSSFEEKHISKCKKAIQELIKALENNGNFNSLSIEFPSSSHLALLGILPDSFKMNDPGKSGIAFDPIQQKTRCWQWLNLKKQCSINTMTHIVKVITVLFDSYAQKILFVETTDAPGIWNLPEESYQPGIDCTISNVALRQVKMLGLKSIQKRMVKQIECFDADQYPVIQQVWAIVVDRSELVELKLSTHIKQAQWILLPTACSGRKLIDQRELRQNIKDLISESLQSFPVISDNSVVDHSKTEIEDLPR